MSKIRYIIIKILLHQFYGIKNIKLINCVKNMNKVYIFEDINKKVKMVLKVESERRINSIKYQHIFSNYGISPKIIKTRTGRQYIKIYRLVIFVQEYVTSSKRKVTSTEIVGFLKYFYGKMDEIREYLPEVLTTYPLYKQGALSKWFYVVHGDLRPQNIIITRDSFSVIDFEYLSLGIRETEILKLIIIICKYQSNLIESLYSKFLESDVIEMHIEEAIRVLLYDLLKSNFPEKVKNNIPKNYFLEITSEREALINFCHTYLKRKEFQK